MTARVDMLISILPKHAVAQVVGYLDGKRAIHVARVFGERKWKFVGRYVSAQGYLVSTVQRDEEATGEYIWRQKCEDEWRTEMTLLR